MKKRFTEEQIVKILGKEAEGKNIKDTCREYGIALVYTQTSTVSK